MIDKSNRTLQPREIEGLTIIFSKPLSSDQNIYSYFGSDICRVRVWENY